MKPRAHIIGGGLAGLAAALRLSQAGYPVTLHEAGPVCGGRCRSYFDRELGCRIDNGNHLLLSGNAAAMAYLDIIGTRDTLAGPSAPAFPFMDLRTGARWTVRPNAGKLPWWIFVPARGVPGAGWRDYLALRKLRGATEGDTVAGLLAHNALYRNLIEPLAISALNTPVEAGSARLLWAVLAGSLAKGGAQCVPCFPRDGLSESFVDPAIAFIRAHGGEVRTASRIAGLRHDAGRITGLSGPDGIIEVTAGSSVILAVAAPNAAQLLPGLAVPDEFEAIINLHFRLVAPGSAPFAQAGFIGLIGGLSEWVFIKPGIVSVTISAANRLADRAGEELAASIWPEVCTALGLPPGDAAPMPPWRLIREKRATFAATPAQQRRRISATTPLRNLVLSGDWTNTGLPATIEGAISSGFVAAQRVGAPPLRGVLARLTA